MKTLFKPKLSCFLVCFLLSPKSFSNESSLYDFMWLDPDKKVYVLQNKVHHKEGTFYGNIGLGQTTNSDFQKSRSFVLQAGHFFHEEWGVEAQYIRYSNKPNTAFQNLSSVNTAYPFIRRFNNSVGAYLIWSPFYGKINTFNKIIYFDWMFGAGATYLDGESNQQTFLNRSAQNSYEPETHVAGSYKTKLQVHLSKSTKLNFEFINQHYRAGKPTAPTTKEMNTVSDAIISIGWSF